MQIENLIVGEIFATLLVFCRIGSALMLMPGVGEMYVPIRVRLLFALAVSYVLAPVLQEQLPGPPGSAMTLMLLIAGEVTVGVFMGLITKILLSAMHVAGMVIASQSSLATAMLFDASMGGQSASVGLFLSVTAIAVIVTMDLHHLMLAAFADSYNLMQAGIMPPAHDMAVYISRIIAEMFDIAVRFSAPIVTAAIIVNLGAGILARVMPQMQVFFVMIPVHLLASIFIIMSTLSAIMLWYVRHVEDTLGHFLTPV